MNTNNQTVANAELAQMDVEALLEMDVDLIEEVADFVPAPTGGYRFNVGTPSIEELGAENKKAIKVPFTLTECTELGDPDSTEDAEVVGNLFSDGKTVEHNEHFFLEAKEGATSAYGIRAFCTIFKGLLPLGQTAKVSELMELAAGSSGECWIEKSSYKKQGSEEVKWSSRIKATAVSFD